MAKTYDREESGDRPVYEGALGTITPYLMKEHRVLDLGCGTGTLALDIAPHVDSVHGLDYSEAMIRAAREKAADLAMDHVHFECGSLESGDYSEASYDAVMSFYLLHLLEDLEQTLGEIHRILPPGGLFLSLTPCLGETMMAKHLLKIGSAVGLVPETRTYRVDELIDLIEKTGFAIERQEIVREKTHEVLLVGRKISV
jgi:ubiquinone/menaquinone biosynthesis C-methylase UbiE